MTESIHSFEIDHENHPVGIYESIAKVSGKDVVTYDIRLYEPNTGNFTPKVAHTIEHIGAVYFRNRASFKDRVIYFGPMGVLNY